MHAVFKAYLHRWYEESLRTKEAQGYTIDLSFEHFLALFSPKQLRSLEQSYVDGRIYHVQAAANPLAYVLTWKSYAACSTGLFNRNTACICSRQKSRQINMPNKGDVLRPSHRKKLSRKLTGVPKLQEHKDAISAASKGKPKAAWTPERKAERRALWSFKRDQGI